MKSSQIQEYTNSFQENAHRTESGVEFWFARKLKELLGYTKWDNFTAVMNKAKTACQGSGHEVADHFADVGNMVPLGSGSQREIEDVGMTQSPTPRLPFHGGRRRIPSCSLNHFPFPT